MTSRPADITYEVSARFLTTRLGGKAGPAEVRPFYGALQVAALSDGNIPYEGEMYGGDVACIRRSVTSGAGRFRHQRHETGHVLN